jgi:16S rRNA (cytosine967-C5)-methyltransferase
VRACAALGATRASGYVNAILRARLRSRTRIDAQLGTNPVALHQHPAWWIDRVRAAYPNDWQQVLSAGNDHPPMCLRVNIRRSNANAYVERLGASGIGARIVGEAAVLLDQPLPVSRVPGFSDGEVSVQDAGAQRAAPALDLHAGQRVLDACAAPGGKSGHILELADVSLTALDVVASRSALVQTNLQLAASQIRGGTGSPTIELSPMCLAPHRAWRAGTRISSGCVENPTSRLARFARSASWMRFGGC